MAYDDFYGDHGYCDDGNDFYKEVFQDSRVIDTPEERKKFEGNLRFQHPEELGWRICNLNFTPSGNGFCTATALLIKSRGRGR